MKQHHLNKARAKRTERRLPSPEEPMDWRIVDLLANMRHLCDQYDLDFAELDRRAYQHYRAEAYHNQSVAQTEQHDA